MKTKKVMTGIMAMAFVIIIANSSWAGDRFHHRQERQYERIADGIRKGEISNHEFIRLSKERARIDHAWKKAMADGRIHRYEKRHLKKMQKKANRHIFHARHNGVTHQHCRSNQRSYWKHGAHHHVKDRHLNSGGTQWAFTLSADHWN